MEKTVEQTHLRQEIAAKALPDHILDNLQSPLLRAAWLAELEPDLPPASEPES
jgi:hypothetical protein